MEFLNLISESKLKQVLKEGAESSGTSLLLYDKFGELIIQEATDDFVLPQYPLELEQASDAKISAQIFSAADGLLSSTTERLMCVLNTINLTANIPSGTLANDS